MPPNEGRVFTAFCAPQTDYSLRLSVAKPKAAEDTGRVDRKNAVNQPEVKNDVVKLEYSRMV